MTGPLVICLNIPNDFYELMLHACLIKMLKLWINKEYNRGRFYSSILIHPHLTSSDGCVDMLDRNLCVLLTNKIHISQMLNPLQSLVPRIVKFRLRKCAQELYYAVDGYVYYNFKEHHKLTS